MSNLCIGLLFFFKCILIFHILLIPFYCCVVFCGIAQIVYPFTIWWSVDCFPLGDIMNEILWPFIYVFCGHLFSFVLGKCLGAELLGYMVSMYEKLPKYFLRCLHFIFPWLLYESFTCFTSLGNVVLPVFHFSPSSVHVVYAIVLIFISLRSNDV